MKTEGHVTIDRPIDEVFEFTIRHVPEWCEIVVEDEVIDETPDGVGTTFRVVTEQRGNRMEFLGEVLQEDIPHESVVILKGDLFDIHIAYTFEDIGRDRTLVRQMSIVKGKRLMLRMMFKLLRFMGNPGERVLNQDFARLKQLLEQRGSNADAKR